MPGALTRPLVRAINILRLFREAAPFLQGLWSRSEPCGLARAILTPTVGIEPASCLRSTCRNCCCKRHSLELDGGCSIRANAAW